MASVTLKRLNKAFGNTLAVKNVSVDIADGEFLVFVGPSGCGKTTTLRMVAGLESLSDGEIRIGDRIVNGLPPGDRDVAMVFQNYALYSHMTVEKNLGFALKARGLEVDEIEKRVRRLQICWTFRKCWDVNLVSFPEGKGRGLHLAGQSSGIPGFFNG